MALCIYSWNTDRDFELEAAERNRERLLFAGFIVGLRKVAAVDDIGHFALRNIEELVQLSYVKGFAGIQGLRRAIVGPIDGALTEPHS